MHLDLNNTCKELRDPDKAAKDNRWSERFRGDDCGLNDRDMEGEVTLELEPRVCFAVIIVFIVISWCGYIDNSNIYNVQYCCMKINI